MGKDFDVLIVGAGMVGATIACGLAKANLSVAIVDTQPPSSFKPSQAPHIRVSAVSHASERVLKNVGAWNNIVSKRVCPYRRLAVSEMPSKAGLSAYLPDISDWARTEFNCHSIGQSHLGHIVENDIVQLGLHETMNDIDGLSVFCPDEILELCLTSSPNKITLKKAGELSAKLVIGADGAQSKVRIEAKLGQYKEQYEQQAFVCTVTYQGKQEDITWQSFTSHGPLAFLPLADSGGKHFASLVWYDFPEQIQKLQNLSDQELLAICQSTYPKALPDLLSVVGKASFPLFKSHALDYVKKGVALAGDAAHTINPLAGQGVNLGFMDAAVLIEVISNAAIKGQDIASFDVLKEYQRLRKGENQTMMNIMDAFYYGFCNEKIPLRIARNIGLGFANRLGFAKNNVMKFAIGASGALPKLART